MSPLNFLNALQIYKILVELNTTAGQNKLVGLLGLEPRLFWTKTRRVASYTIGQKRIKCTRKFFRIPTFL